MCYTLPPPLPSSFPTFVIAPLLLVNLGNVLMDLPNLLELPQFRQKRRGLSQGPDGILGVDIFVAVGCCLGRREGEREGGEGSMICFVISTSLSRFSQRVSTPTLAPTPLPPALSLPLAFSLTRFLCRVRRVICAAKLDMQFTRLGEGLPSLRPCLGHLEAVPRLGVSFRGVLEFLVGVKEGEALQGLFSGMGG